MNPKFYEAQAAYENQMPDDTSTEEARVAAWQQHYLERADGETLAEVLNQDFAWGDVVKYPCEFEAIHRMVAELAVAVWALPKNPHEVSALANTIVLVYASVLGDMAAAKTTEWPE